MSKLFTADAPKIARKGYCSSVHPDLKAPPSEGSIIKRTQQDLQNRGLTPRQVEVLRWVAEGKTNQEIADILGCSFHTTKNHLKQILNRLGVSSRTAAACTFYEVKSAHQKLKHAASPQKPDLRTPRQAAQRPSQRQQPRPQSPRSSS